MHRKRERSTDVEEIMNSNLFKDDPVRYLALEYVKTHVIQQWTPFSQYDKEDQKRFLLMYGENSPTANGVLTRLGSKGVSV